MDVKVDLKVGTKTNLVSEALLNLFFSSHVQYQTFQASCGFKLSFWCLTARETLLPLKMLQQLTTYPKGIIYDSLHRLVPNCCLIPT